MKYILFSIIFLPILVCSQSYLLYHGDTVNKINSNGLRYGRQIHFMGGIHKTRCEGNEKIICLKNINWGSQEKNAYVFATYKYVKDKSGNDILYSSKFKDSLSVRDGYWLEYEYNDYNPLPLIVKYYKNGIEIISKNIYNNNIKTETIHKDEPNNFYNYEYYDGDTTLSRIRYMSGKNKDKIDCFPNSNLVIDKCEFGLYALYSQTDCDTIILTSRNSEQVLINEIICSNSDIKITNSKGEKINNLLISKNKKDTVFVFYSPKKRTNPHTNKYNYYADIKIITSDYNYLVNAKLLSAHINPNNWEIKEFTLKKEKYNSTILEIELGNLKYYLLSNSAELSKLDEYLANGDYSKVLSVNRWNNPDIDVTSLPLGEYYLVIKDYDKVFNTIKIIITE
jgi:hypothetical protein